MRSTKQLSVTLPNEIAREVAARVASGEYASESEVIGEGLRALSARQNADDHWLRAEVASVYHWMKRDPARGRSTADVKTTLAQARQPACASQMKRSGDGAFSPEAESQIVGIYEYLADHASPAIAEACAKGIVERCEQPGDMPLVGMAREDVRPGLRTVFFRKRVVIACAITSRAVTILGLFCGGQYDESLLREE